MDEVCNMAWAKRQIDFNKSCVKLKETTNK